jgi:hypothetical protein
VGCHGRTSGSLGHALWWGLNPPLTYGHAHGDLIENGARDYVAVAPALRLSPARKCVAVEAAGRPTCEKPVRVESGVGGA